MQKFLQDFKKFAFKGNMLDLAVGMIIGAAFTNLVNSIVKNLIMPIISVFTGGIDFNNKYIALSEAARAAQNSGADIETARKAGAVFAYGSFLTDFLQFLILAFVVFCILRYIGKIMALTEKNQPAPITTKTCPYCKSEIPVDAIKCAHCTADLN